MITYDNATPEQRRAVENRIHGTVVLQSALVDMLLTHEEISSFGYEDIENLDRPVCLVCREPVTIAQTKTATCDCCGWTGNLDDCELEYQQIMEWWLITDTWEIEQLQKAGEPVLDNDYGSWWGRTCTGQSIVLDPTFWEIWQEWVMGLD